MKMRLPTRVKRIEHGYGLAQMWAFDKEAEMVEVRTQVTPATLTCPSCAARCSNLETLKDHIRTMARGSGATAAQHAALMQLFEAPPEPAKTFSVVGLSEEQARSLYGLLGHVSAGHPLFAVFDALSGALGIGGADTVEYDRWRAHLGHGTTGVGAFSLTRV